MANLVRTDNGNLCLLPGSTNLANTGEGIDCICKTPPQLGACCIPNDTDCHMLFEDNCLANNGQFFGEGSICSPPGLCDPGCYCPDVQLIVTITNGTLIAFPSNSFLDYCFPLDISGQSWTLNYTGVCHWSPDPIGEVCLCAPADPDCGGNGCYDYGGCPWVAKGSAICNQSDDGTVTYVSICFYLYLGHITIWDLCGLWQATHSPSCPQAGSLIDWSGGPFGTIQPQGDISITVAVINPLSAPSPLTTSQPELYDLIKFAKQAGLGNNIDEIAASLGMPSGPGCDCKSGPKRRLWLLEIEKRLKQMMINV